MNVHKNARLTPIGRALIVMQVECGQTPQAAARAAGVCPRRARKWVARYRAEGLAGLADRCSRPRTLHRSTQLLVVDAIIALRRQRLSGNHIALRVGVAPATVSRVLKRAGLRRMKDLEPAAAVRRYEHADPGGLIHIDITRLGRFDRIGHRITGNRKGQSRGRGVGWEFVHVCIDDAARIAFTQIKPDEKAVSATPFLKTAVAYYSDPGLRFALAAASSARPVRALENHDIPRRLALRLH